MMMDKENHMDNEISEITSKITLKPNTIAMKGTPFGAVHDDGKGRLICSTGECVGAVDYENAIIEFCTVPSFDYPNLADRSEPRKLA